MQVNTSLFPNDSIFEFSMQSHFELKLKFLNENIFRPEIFHTITIRSGQ